MSGGQPRSGWPPKVLGHSDYIAVGVDRFLALDCAVDIVAFDDYAVGRAGCCRVRKMKIYLPLRVHADKVCAVKPFGLVVRHFALFVEEAAVLVASKFKAFPF